MHKLSLATYTRFLTRYISYCQIKFQFFEILCFKHRFTCCSRPVRSDRPVSVRKPACASSGRPDRTPSAAQDVHDVLVHLEAIPPNVPADGEADPVGELGSLWRPARHTEDVAAGLNALKGSSGSISSSCNKDPGTTWISSARSAQTAAAAAYVKYQVHMNRKVTRSRSRFSLMTHFRVNDVVYA